MYFINMAIKMGNEALFKSIMMAGLRTKKLCLVGIITQNFHCNKYCLFFYDFVILFFF